MKKINLMLASVLMMGSTAFAQNCTETYGQGKQAFTLATGSPGELGLLQVLAEAFSSEKNVKMCWIKAGSGKSLQLLQADKIDVAMVHAPQAEKDAVKAGWASNKTLIGSNEFYIVGPKNDPAGIVKAKSVQDVYAFIAKTQAKFITRADNSGTHKKEMSIWEKAKITPEGAWYIPSKTFMLASLQMADKDGAYFMTDSSTWVAGKKDMKNTKVLFRGDPYLINTYNALTRPKGDGAMQKIAVEFVDFVASDKGQKLLREYGKKEYGEGMYNDAVYAKKYDK